MFYLLGTFTYICTFLITAVPPLVFPALPVHASPVLPDDAMCHNKKAPYHCKADHISVHVGMKCLCINTGMDYSTPSL